MERRYGQFCPVAKAAEIFCERWNALILRELGAGSTRFSELRRGVPLMSTSMLARRLKELEREGVIARLAAPGAAGSYRLTEAGREFLPVVEALGTWGQRWTRRTLDPGEVDHALLLWDMERTVRGDAFGPGRTTIRLELPDRPAGGRLWWFVNERPAAELCVKDPGFEVDVFLRARTADLIHVWRGDLSLARALGEDRLEAIGPGRILARLGDWLNLGPLARVAPARNDLCL